MTNPSATPTQRRASSAHSPDSVPIVRYSDGTIYAMSLTQPGVTYRVQLDPASCQCAGFAHRGQCCHLAAAQQRFGVECYWCRSTVDVRTYSNHNDDDAEIALCAQC